MDSILAQFPLQMVAFPGQTVPLHIFEPRYRALISDCEALDILFGILPVIDNELMEVGTTMKLKQIDKKYADGRMDIKVEAIDVYQVINFRKEGKRSYPEADVIAWPFEEHATPDHVDKYQKLVAELYAVMQIDADPAQAGLFDLAHKTSMTLLEEYALLKMSDATARYQMMIERLEKLIPQIRELEEVRRRISMNGSYRHFIPPDI